MFSHRKRANVDTRKEEDACATPGAYDNFHPDIWEVRRVRRVAKVAEGKVSRTRRLDAETYAPRCTTRPRNVLFFTSDAVETS